MNQDLPIILIVNDKPEIAAQLAVQDAAKTLKAIKSIYISHLQGDVDKGKIVRFRVNAKITFEVKS